MTTEAKYNELMQTLRTRKAESGISNSQIAEYIGESRVNAIKKLQSRNILLKGFLSLADCLGYEVELRPRTTTQAAQTPQGLSEQMYSNNMDAAQALVKALGALGLAAAITRQSPAGSVFGTVSGYGLKNTFRVSTRDIILNASPESEDFKIRCDYELRPIPGNGIHFFESQIRTEADGIYCDMDPEG